MNKKDKNTDITKMTDGEFRLYTNMNFDNVYHEIKNLKTGFNSLNGKLWAIIIMLFSLLSLVIAGIITKGGF